MRLSVTIDFIAHAKIMHWIRKADEFEVSGFGKVIRHGGSLFVNDVFLLEQVNTAGSTVLDAPAIARALYEKRQDPGDFNFWWHSHHYMRAFWSQTDYDTIAELGGNGWLLATVFNRDADTETALYVTEPAPFLTEGLKLKISDPVLPAEFRTELDTEYATLVTEEKPKPVKRWEEVPKYGTKEWRRYLRELARDRRELALMGGSDWMRDVGYD